MPRRIRYPLALPILDGEWDRYDDLITSVVNAGRCESFEFFDSVAPEMEKGEKGECVKKSTKSIGFC